METLTKYSKVSGLLFLILLSLFFGCEQKEDPVDPIACFSISSDEVEVDELVTFSNCSTNAETYSWDFGDGGSSTDISPSHSYSTPGQYAVKLKAYNKGKLHEETKKVKVVDGGGTATLTACFSYDPPTVVVNKAIEFINCSDGEDTYSWDFGDGGTSTLEDPVHTFSEVGSYTVTLKVAAGNETDEVQKIIQVQKENVNSTSVTFFLQMYVPYAWGDFDPEYDNVEIIGDFNNWGSDSDLTMFRMNDTSYIYGIELTNIEIGSEILFRFKANTREGSFEETDESGVVFKRYHMVSSVAKENILSFWYEDEDMLWIDSYDYYGVPINTFSTYYLDDFSDARISSYFQGTGEDYSASIGGGVYEVKNLNPDYYKLFTSGLSGPDENSNYEFEYAMRTTSFEASSGGGLIWGVTDSGDLWKYFAFYTSPKGGYTAGDSGSEWVSWLDWTTGANISPSYNKVTIRKMNTSYYIFVNEEFVHEQAVSSFYGSRYGVAVGQTLTVEYDYINVKYINVNFAKANVAIPIIHPEHSLPKKAMKAATKQEIINLNR